MINRFPADRINNFCDAVFAIAMTLLILELKIPSVEVLQRGFSSVLIGLIPSFMGFLISFLVTALYWRSHLMLAQFVKSYDNRLLWLTVWLLMTVVLLPFSTAFYAKYSNYNGPFIFYCINLILIGIFNFFMVNYIARKEGYSGEFTPTLVSWLRVRALLAPFVWLLSIAWVFIEPISSRFLFILIFVAQVFIDRRYKRKKEAEAASKPL